MASKLAGKVAMVTGGSRGIGRGIALAYAREGADVALGYRRDEAAAAEVVKEIAGMGRRAAAYQADVRDLEALNRMVAGAVDTLGGLDIVVANAGVPTRFEPLHVVEPSYFDRVIQIDLYGVFNTLHAALPRLREQRSGVILTVSSIAADGCMANGGPYVAAKAAVNALTKVVARENAKRNIRVNVISPGLIATDLADGMQQAHGDAVVDVIPLGRMGTPQEVAGLAVYLASDEGRWITGKNFRIDGGQW